MGILATFCLFWLNEPFKRGITSKHLQKKQEKFFFFRGGKDDF